MIASPCRIYGNHAYPLFSEEDMGAVSSADIGQNTSARSIDFFKEAHPFTQGLYPMRGTSP